MLEYSSSAPRTHTSSHGTPSEKSQMPDPHDVNRYSVHKLRASSAFRAKDPRKKVMNISLKSTVGVHRSCYDGFNANTFYHPPKDISGRRHRRHSKHNQFHMLMLYKFWPTLIFKPWVSESRFSDTPRRNGQHSSSEIRNTYLPTDREADNRIPKQRQQEIGYDFITHVNDVMSYAAIVLEGRPGSAAPAIVISQLQDSAGFALNKIQYHHDKWTQSLHLKSLW